VGGKKHTAAKWPEVLKRRGRRPTHYALEGRLSQQQTPYVIRKRGKELRGTMGEDSIIPSSSPNRPGKEGNSSHHIKNLYITCSNIRRKKGKLRGKRPGKGAQPFS